MPGEEHPVERAQDRDERDAFAAVRAAALLSVIPRTRASAHGADQSVLPGTGGFTLTWKKDAKTSAAAGAAAMPPWPPFSITAQTTSFGRVASARSRTTRTGPGGRRSRAATRPSPPCRSCPRSRRGRCRRRDRTCRRAGASPPRGPCWTTWSAAGSTPTACGAGRAGTGTRRAVRALDVHQHVRRHELAAVREQRVEARHLHRRHGEVALADRELDRVARLPELVDRRLEVLHAPADRRHEAGRLRAEVGAGRASRSRRCAPTSGAAGRGPSSRRTCRRVGRSTCRTSTRARSACPSAG